MDTQGANLHAERKCHLFELERRAISIDIRTAPSWDESVNDKEEDDTKGEGKACRFDWSERQNKGRERMGKPPFGRSGLGSALKSCSFLIA